MKDEASGGGSQLGSHTVGGRGALFAQLVQKKGLHSDPGGATALSPEPRKIPGGRGRADIMKALKVGAVTLQPGAEPL